MFSNFEWSLIRQNFIHWYMESSSYARSLKWFVYVVGTRYNSLIICMCLVKPAVRQETNPGVLQQQRKGSV